MIAANNDGAVGKAGGGSDVEMGIGGVTCHSGLLGSVDKFLIGGGKLVEGVNSYA